MQSSLPEQQDRPDPTRRRLARGGLAGTVVLGALVSKPVLGAVPYNCTISGQMSGNTSSHGAPVPCSTLGKSVAQWLAFAPWPGVTKGVLPPGNSYPTGIGTVFNGFSGLATSFRFTSPPASVVAFDIVDGTRPASMLQVLNTTDPAANFVFGRETVAAILNSLQGSGTFPLTTAQVVAMYNAVYNGGTFPVNATTNWTRAQVQAYFQSLHV